MRNWNEEEYKEHRAKKQEAQDAKDLDKKNAPESTLVCTTDTQALLIAPKTNSSAMFFRTKLNVHNLSYYNLRTRAVSNYLWRETDGNLDADNFTMIQIRHLENEINADPNITHIIQWSDGCGYQNRNKVLSSALLSLAHKKQITITQKYLEKGHTYMEVDTAHQKIEVGIKKRNINIPEDYLDVIDKARINPSKFRGEFLTHVDFKNSEKINSIKSIRPGKERVGEPTVNDIQQIRYSPCGKISLNLSHSGDWIDCPHRYFVQTVEPEPLYKEKIKIAASKYMHIMELIKDIPQIYHQTYIDLPHRVSQGKPAAPIVPEHQIEELPNTKPCSKRIFRPTKKSEEKTLLPVTRKNKGKGKKIKL